MFRGSKRVLRLLASGLAVLYFLLDSVVLAALRPLLAWIGRQPPVIRAQRWVASLGPYPTLALLLVPLVILEPAKPVGFYLLASGRPFEGGLILAGGELLKIVTVERLFRASRAKLLTIPWFARGYGMVTRWLGWVRSLGAWRLMVRVHARIRAWIKGEARRLFDRLRRAR